MTPPIINCRYTTDLQIICTIVCYMLCVATSLHMWETYDDFAIAEANGKYFAKFDGRSDRISIGEESSKLFSDV